MKVEIIYVTFRRDYDFLHYSMRSFRKYCKGFSGVKIVVPTQDVELFLEFERRYSTPECPVLVKNFLEYPGKGFVHHLAMQCCADVFCPKADLILHMDPDCLWSKPSTPNDYIVDGKPVLVIEPYSVIKEYFPGRYNWKAVTEMALGYETPYETMCRHPAIHWPITYRLTRKRVEEVHMTPFIDFVLKQQNSFPQGFGEFNTLGAVAVNYGDHYHFVDCGPARLDRLAELKAKPELKIGHPDENITQFWSYHLKSGIYDKDIERILTQ